MDLQGMYQGKTKASLPSKFKFPKGCCVIRWPDTARWEGPSHCPRIIENMILSSLIYTSFLDYWLYMSHLILASRSRHLLFASLNWQFGNQFFASLIFNGEFHCIVFNIIQNLILNPKQQTQNSSPSAKSHRDFRETAALASQSWYEVSRLRAVGEYE